MKNLVIALLISCSFYSCKKERAFHITATNPATGQRIPNLHYYLVELTQGSFEEKSKTVREGDLDANGEAKFNFKIKNKTHVIRVVRPENNCYTENLSLTFGSKENIIANFKFAPCGFVKININNVNCEGPNDVMSYRRKYDYLDWTSNNFDFPGCYTFSAPEFSNFSTGRIVHEMKVVRSGATTYVYDTTFLNAGEYKTINLFY